MKRLLLAALIPGLLAACSTATPGAGAADDTSAQAVASARISAGALAGAADFIEGDATEFAAAAPRVAELVIVNPPRRGIGAARDVIQFREIH